MTDWLLADRNNAVAQAAAADLQARLGPDFSPVGGVRVVLGGDGFLLRTIAAHDHQGVFLGLNAGNLGFLHNDIDDLGEAADQLAAGDWTVHEFPLLEARVTRPDGTERAALAMNELYLERATGQAARLTLTIDGIEVVDGLVCDGLIVATALGSTAYSFSAGGAPAHPLLRLLKITPVCPHLPRLTPFDLPRRVTVRIDVGMAHRRPVRAVVDGDVLEDEVASVEVGLSDRVVQLAYLGGHDFTGHLLRKIVIP